MTPHDYIDLGLLLGVIIPVWTAAYHFFFTHKEYPLHLHDERDGLRIKYPKGMEPTHYIKGEE